MYRGYVKIWRRSKQMIKDHKLWACWSFLLMSAAHKRAVVYLKDNEFVLNPGDIVVTQQSLSDDINLTRQETRTTLRKLESRGMITVNATNVGTVISITNWETYQVVKNGEQPTANQRLTNEQPTHIYKKNVEEGGEAAPLPEKFAGVLKWMNDE